jgi:hypothetical protein
LLPGCSYAGSYCEATGRQVKHDNIIEVAAVLHTQHRDPRLQEPHSFSSLCKTSRKLHREVEQLTGLTKHSLRNEPSVEEVLDWFFNWIKDTVAAAFHCFSPLSQNFAPENRHCSGNSTDLTSTTSAIKQWSETSAHALKGLGSEMYMRNST